MAYDAYDLAQALRDAADRIEKYKRQQDDLSEKIRILKRKRETIINMKKIFKDTMKKDKNIIGAKYKWKGSWYSNDFKRDTRKLMDEENNYYRRTLDYIHDSINTKINELENEKYKLGDSIFRLNRSMRELRTKIDNLTN